MKTLDEATLDELAVEIAQRVEGNKEPRRTVLAQLVLGYLHRRLGMGELSLTAMRAIRTRRPL